MRKVENGQTTYCLRSSVLGSQVICEIDGGGVWQKGYVYMGGQMLALQQSGAVTYVHQDPVTKSQRMTDTAGTVVANATIELDPFGGETGRTSNNRQSHVFTSYERDAAGMDEAGARKYHGWWSRFDQPDPYDGSYNLSDPQSFNRYSYVQNDPVNFTDPSGLEMSSGSSGSGFCDASNSFASCGGNAGFWGSGGGGGGYFGPGGDGGEYAGMPANVAAGLSNYLQRLDFTLTRLYGPFGQASEYGGYAGRFAFDLLALQHTQLPKGTPEKYVSGFTKALAEAKKRIEKNDKCASLFGGKDKALALLNGAEYRFLPLGAPKYNSQTGDYSVIGAQTNSPTSVFINTQGPFLNPSIPGTGSKPLDFGTGLRGAAFGSLILLHELGHQAGIFGSDAKNDDLNRSYTRQVQRACF